MSILTAIVENTVRRVAERRGRVPESELASRIRDAAPTRSFRGAIAAGFGVIAEHKRRSPSGGPMEPSNVARAYETYAAAPWVVALSVLTDEDYFAGSLDDLGIARERVKKPILRKDFIVDDYQVLEARAFGADAILLMASVLADRPGRMQSLYELARSLDLDVLVELGAAERRLEDLVALVPPGAQIVGINARVFATSKPGNDADPSARHALPTDLRQHRTYRRLVPESALAVAESGINTLEELASVRDAGYHAALIGTAFLKGPRDIGTVADELGGLFREKSR
ncbi:MAG TPA: indole-3-glycerol phosphate synthase TrpC [Polyangiaceae bacterium]|jgi:indole-3-glycerol phosphate synthase|nr:indole-3-glycerol phosphate synthase TrpC [Polyangiaceae bacterium]